MTDDMKERLEKIAVALSDRVLEETGEEKTPLPEITSAFKALTNYYAMTKKLPAPNPEEKEYGWKDAATNPSDGGRGNGSRPTPDF